MITLAQVKAALVDAITAIKTPHFVTEFKATNVLGHFSADFIKMRDDKFYPKAFVIIDQGSSENEPSSVVNKKVDFTVIFVVKKFAKNDKEPEDKILQAIEDFEQSLFESSFLNDNVSEISISDFTTDSGYTNPEGIVIFKVSVSYKKDFNEV